MQTILCSEIQSRCVWQVREATFCYKDSLFIFLEWAKQQKQDTGQLHAEGTLYP